MRERPKPQSLLELLELANSKLLTLPCVAFPTIKALSGLSPHSVSVCLLNDTGALHVALCGVVWPLRLGNVSYQNLLSMALASPYHHSVTSINYNVTIMLLYIIWYPPSPMESRLNKVTDLCMFCSWFWCLELCLAHGRTSIDICWMNEWVIEWMLLVPLITQHYSKLWASLAQKLHLAPFYITRLSLSIWLKAQRLVWLM